MAFAQEPPAATADAEADAKLTCEQLGPEYNALRAKLQGDAAADTRNAEQVKARNKRVSRMFGVAGVLVERSKATANPSTPKTADQKRLDRLEELFVSKGC